MPSPPLQVSMARQPIVALGKAVPAEAGVPPRVVHPARPRHEQHSGRAGDDTATALDVLARDATGDGMLVLTNHKVATEALTADRQVCDEAPPFQVLVHVPRGHTRDLIDVAALVRPGGRATAVGKRDLLRGPPKGAAALLLGVAEQVPVVAAPR